MDKTSDSKSSISDDSFVVHSTSTASKKSTSKKLSKQQPNTQSSQSSILEILNKYTTTVRKNTKNKTTKDKEQEKALYAKLEGVIKEYEAQREKILDYEIQLEEKEDSINTLSQQIEELNIKCAREIQLKVHLGPDISHEASENQKQELINESNTCDDSDSSQDENTKGKKAQNFTKEPKAMSTPKMQRQTAKMTKTPAKVIKYDEFQVKNMTMLDLAEAFVKLINSKVKNSTEEAHKFKEEFLRRISILEEETVHNREALEKQIMEKEKIIQELTEKTNKLNNEKEVVTLTCESCIDNTSMLEAIATEQVNDKENNENKLQQKQEEIELLKKQIIEKERLIEDLEKTLTSTQEIINSKYIENLQQQHQVLLRKLEGIEQNTQKLTEDMKKVPMQQTTTGAPEKEQSAPLYSQITARQQKNPTQYSESALLLKKTVQTKLSLNDIRTILNKETKSIPQLPRVYCEPARDKETLIIKGETEDDTNTILKIIENIEPIKKITELTFKAHNNKKLIILGIPKIIEVEEVLDKIKHQTQAGKTASVQRVMSREGSSLYQLVVEMKDSEAAALLQKGKLLLGFNVCRITYYKPVIRCNRCQRYGHTDHR